MEYRIIEKNNVEMIEVTPINSTGIAEGYCSTRRGGVSKGPTASMSVNLYKKFDVEAGQENFRIFCNAINVNPDKVITNRLIYGTDVVRCPNAMKTHSIDNLAVIDKNIELMTSVVSVQMVNHSKSERHAR